MTQVEQIKDYLNSRIKEGKECLNDTPASAIVGLVQAYKNTLSFINSLEEEPFDYEHATIPQKDFASCIQEGDKIVTNEDGTKFNVSQLERVAISEDLKKEPKSQRMISAEVKEALYNTPENLDLENEIEKYYVNSSKELGHVLFEDFHIMASHFANWQKEQMLKDAIDGFISDDAIGKFLYFDTLGFNIAGLKFQDGDKVKIIIVKEE